MNTPEYLAINPMGKVPPIVHDGHIVTECAAICAYLAEPVEAAVTDHSMAFDPAPDKEMMFGSIPARPAIVAYAERVRRAAYQSAKAIDGTLIAESQPVLSA